MKIIFNLLLPALLLLIGIGAGAQVVYQNDFNNISGWDSKYTSKSFATDVSISAGNLILNPNTADSWFQNGPEVSIDFTKDFTIETSMAVYSDNPVHDTYYGIFFGASSNLIKDNLFIITEDGYSKIESYTDKINTKVEYQKFNAVKKGRNVFNKIVITKRGSAVYFYANDVEFAKLSDIEMYGSRMGFKVSRGVSVAVDYLSIKYGSESAITPIKNHDLTDNILDNSIIYSTNFSDANDDVWYTADDEYMSSVRQTNLFTFKRKKEIGTSFRTSQINIDWTKDFAIETEVLHMAGISNNDYGLVFGYDNAENFYSFGISSNGYFILRSCLNNVYTNLWDWTNSAAVNKWDNVINNIRVEKRGKILYAFINAEQVLTYPMPNLPGKRVGFFISNNQEVSFKKLNINYLQKSNIENADKNAPSITISSPIVSRGLIVTEHGKKITVTGKAIDESGIYEVMVNGIEAKVDASGNFSATVPLAIGENNFTVTATDVKMNKGDYSFTVNRTPAENIETPIIPVSNNTEMVQGGKYYALIIGIEDYQDPTIPDLEEPVGDASSLSNILNAKYTFEKENIRLLKNPTRYQVFQALETLSKKVKESDNLLIFYAGHGYWDEQRKQGYWFPSDGKKADRSSWITNADLKEYISTIPSKHTLLITDACFAGSIFKSRSIVSTASMAVKQLYELPSRKAMTSGSLKEVPDKSVFIEYLVKRLSQNSEKFLSAEQLFSSFRTAVINNSANGQVPQYGEIKEAGDEGGDFIFIKR